MLSIHLTKLLMVKACFSALPLSTQRASVGIAVYGDKLYFAGGIDLNRQRSDIVDVYDTATLVWSSFKIPIARDNIEVVSVGSFVLFAGGTTTTGQYNKVDILNLDTATVRTMDLPSISFTITNSLVMGSQAIFYGKDNSTIIVINPTEHTYSEISALARAGLDFWTAATNGTHLFTCINFNGMTLASVFLYKQTDGNWSRIHEWRLADRTVAFFMTRSAFVFVHESTVSTQPLNPSAGTGPTYTTGQASVIAPLMIGEELFLVDSGRMISLDANGRIRRYGTEYQVQTSTKSIYHNGTIYYATEDILEPVIMFNTQNILKSFAVPKTAKQSPPFLAISDYLFWRLQSTVIYLNVRTGQSSSHSRSGFRLETVHSFVVLADRVRVDVFNTETEEWKFNSVPFTVTPTSSASSETSGLIAFVVGSAVFTYDASKDTWLSHYILELPTTKIYLANYTIVSVSNSSIETFNIQRNQQQIVRFSERIDFTIEVTDSVVVLAGGRYSDSPNVTTDVIVFDVAQSTSFNIQLSVGRRNPTVALYNNLVVFAGGQLQSGRISDRIEVFFIQTLEWFVSNLPAHSIISPVRVIFVQGNIFFIRTNRLDIMEVATNSMRVAMFQFGAVRYYQAFGSKLILISTIGPRIHQLAVFETSTDAWSTYEVNRLGIDAGDPFTFVSIVANQLYVHAFLDDHQIMPFTTMMNRLNSVTVPWWTFQNFTVDAIGSNLAVKWTHNNQLQNETSLSFSIGNITASSEGAYTVRIIDQCSMPMQQQFSIAVLAPPSITQLEDTLGLCEEELALPVIVSGTNLTIQWSIDGENVAYTLKTIDSSTLVTNMLFNKTMLCSKSSDICLKAVNPSGTVRTCATLRLLQRDAIFQGPSLSSNSPSVWFYQDVAELWVTVLVETCANHTWFDEGNSFQITSPGRNSSYAFNINATAATRTLTVKAYCGNVVLTSNSFQLNSPIIPLTKGIFSMIIVLGTAFIAAMIVTPYFIARRIRKGKQHEIELQQLLSRAKNESLTQNPRVFASWIPTEDFTYYPLYNLPCNIDISELTSQIKNDPVEVDTWAQYYATFSLKGKKSKRVSQSLSMKESLIKGTPINLYAPSSPKYLVNIEPSSFVLEDSETIQVKICIMMLMTVKCTISMIVVCERKKIYSVFEFKLASKMSTWIDLEEIEMNGDYLGGGGFGAVYRGNYRGQEVAVKQLLNQHLDEYTKREFEREVMLMKDLRHPNIVQFVGASKVKDNLAIVIEFAPLGSLSSILELHKLSTALKLAIMIEIAKALQFLHANGVIHRDIKPQNVLVFSLEQRAPVHIKLTDFGTSRFISDDPQTITRNVGTTCYMAPEALGHSPKIDKSADIYSFAILMWEVMLEKQPFSDFRWQSDVEAHVKSGKRLQFSEDANSEFVKLVEDCWQQDPACRPTMTVILQRLSTLAL